MSKYIPHKAVEREFVQHLKRVQHGLKTGFYVKYPDVEKGPHIIKAKELARIQARELVNAIKTTTPNQEATSESK